MREEIGRAKWIGCSKLRDHARYAYPAELLLIGGFLCAELEGRRDSLCAVATSPSGSGVEAVREVHYRAGNSGAWLTARLDVIVVEKAGDLMIT